MSNAKDPTQLLPFDPVRYLADDAAIAEYMIAVLEADDPDLLLLALGDVARAGTEPGMPLGRQDFREAD